LDKTKMAHVEVDCNNEFSENLPFVLQGRVSPDRWAQTAHSINHIFRTKRPNRVIFIFTLFFLWFGAVALNIFLLLTTQMWFGWIFMIVAFCLSIFVIVYYNNRYRSVTASIHQLLANEGSHYNQHGVNLVFCPGYRYVRPHIDIQIRDGTIGGPPMQMYQQQQGMYAPNTGLVSGGQPIYGATAPEVAYQYVQPQYQYQQQQPQPQDQQYQYQQQPPK